MPETAMLMAAAINRTADADLFMAFIPTITLLI
jgi:hypothetical protein